MVAFLGTGLLGAGFIKGLLKRGEQVNVWNRSLDKAKALEVDGAKAFEDVAEAVKGARLLHICLSDDNAVDDVLQKAVAGLSKDTIIIDHTTTSPDGAAKRTQEWGNKGFTFIHAPVFMGPANALDSTGMMLISGNQDVIKKVEADLSKMTGKLWNLGEAPAKAAGIKLMGNLFLISMTGAMTDMLTLAKSLDIPVADATNLLESWNPAAMLPARMKRITEEQYKTSASWHLSMARKDARLMMESAEKGNEHLVTIPGIAAEMDEYLDNGHANDDWMVIASNSVKR